MKTILAALCALCLSAVSTFAATPKISDMAERSTVPVGTEAKWSIPGQTSVRFTRYSDSVIFAGEVYKADTEDSEIVRFHILFPSFLANLSAAVDREGMRIAQVIPSLHNSGFTILLEKK